MAHRPTALRKMLDEGSPLTLQFNLNGGFADAANALKATDTTSRVGQTSLFGLKPYTVEQKFDMLKRMIARGQVSLAPGVSLESVKHEMKKPENDGLGVNEMASRLAQKKMLKVAGMSATLKVKTPAYTPF